MSELWRNREFLAFLAGQCLDRFGASSLTVLIGFQVYTLRSNPLDLALLGLVEVLPALSLALIGGDVADRVSRHTMMLMTTASLAALATVAALASTLGQGLLPLILAVAFLSASIRAFQNPAAVGLEAQVLPQHLVLKGVPVLSLGGRIFDMTGPVVMGFAWAHFGAVATYACLAALFTLSCLTFWRGIAPKPVLKRGDGEPIFRRIAEGVRFVFGNQILIGSMALDLFAVFFGGATALLPVFATDILGVGAAGVGLMRAAIAAGALSAALLATRYMPRAHAGLTLHAVIVGFGCAMIVFGLSTSYALSLVALFLSGVCDGLSMVIRHAIMRLASPEALRGRIAAVRMVFVGSSNELGAMESGLATAWLGPARAVWAGGAFTILVVAIVAWRSPALLSLNLDRYMAPEGVKPAAA